MPSAGSEAEQRQRILVAALAERSDGGELARLGGVRLGRARWRRGPVPAARLTAGSFSLGERRSSAGSAVASRRLEHRLGGGQALGRIRAHSVSVPTAASMSAAQRLLTRTGFSRAGTLGRGRAGRRRRQ